MAIKSQIGENTLFGSINRHKSIKFIVYLIGIVFIFRLAQLQLLKGTDYTIESQAQAIKKIRIAPFRGNMFDRHGKLIVMNQPSFSLSITPSEFEEYCLPLLANILEIDTSEIQKIIKRNRQFSPYVPFRIIRDLSFEKITQIEEYADYLPGVEIAVDSKRIYDFKGNMAHLLGYSGEISQEDLLKNEFYFQGDIVGKSGLEKEYETMLRGREGLEYVAVNNRGLKVAKFANGKNDISAHNGFDLHLSIDIELQQRAEKLLEGKRGAVVAIDPNNGEILVFACKPDYDPREFSGKVKREYYSSLLNNEGKPFLNRTAAAAYPPGSAWKMLIGIAGLNEAIIDENSRLNCIGGYSYGGRFFKCMHTHGSVNLRQAIQGSCNAFFYQLSLKIGIKKVIEYGQMFGFGSKTMLDLQEEKKGNYPDEAKLKKIYKGNIPRGLLLNYGIGQGEILVTPIQMAYYAATLANKGKLIQPHIVKSIYNNLTNKNEPLNYQTKSLNISEKIFDIIRDGMWDVVNTPGGTAYNSARLPGLDVCGKTSTAQNSGGKDHGWFVSFAPKANPKIAVAVIIENMGFGGVVAAPVAKDIMNCFFNRELLKDSTNSNSKNIINTDSLNDIEPKVEPKVVGKKSQNNPNN